jgi:hypothetical protein
MATKQEEEILSGLRELTIIPSNKNGFGHLAYLCSLHCARTLDTSLSVIPTLNRPLDYRVKNTLQLEIIPEEESEDDENSAYAPSEVIDVPIEELETIIHLSRIYESISLMVSTFSGISANFSHLLIHLIESNNFDFEDVLFYLQEVAIFTGLMVKFENFAGFSEMWQIFQEFSIKQVDTFKRFMETCDFEYANDLLWKLLTVTQDQSLFLKSCVEQTSEHHALMQELSKSWHTMLDIQNRFIVKLIENLDASKTTDYPRFSNFVQC